MATTTYSSLRYPLSTNSPNVNQDIQNLASDLDQKVRLLVANPTARNAISSKFDGLLVYEQSSQRTFRWNAANSRWDYVSGPWYTWTPSLVDSGGTAVTGVSASRGLYIIRESMLRFKASMLFGATIDGRTGELVMVMPTGTVRHASEPLPYGFVNALLYTPIVAPSWWSGMGYPNAAAKIGLLFPTSAGNASMSVFVNATSAGATGTGTPLVPGSYPLTNSSRLDVWGEYELDSWPAL